MIRIYAAETKDLPSLKTLKKQVVIDVGEEKRAVWDRQPCHRAKESIAGILLLQYAMEKMGCSPDGVTLAYEAKGRPYLKGIELDFSISHSGGVAVCAVEQSLGGTIPRIGVDVETVRNRSADSMERNAARWFTESERKMFFADKQEMQFLRIWTGKEALCKRSGEGLSEVSQWDATALSQELRITIYSLQNGVISLCHPADMVPPENVEWIKDRWWL